MPVEPQIEEQYENLLMELRTLIESDGFLVRHRQSKTDFVRNRCLSFVVVVFMLINMLKRSVQDELDELFRLFSGDEVADRCVTKSAFSQARQKLKHTAFIELNQTQVAHIYRHFAVERWHDRRLLGLDGSLADVPNTEANRREFGSWGSRHGTQTAKARLSQLFDVLNNITVDGIIAPKRQGERVLAKQHLDHVQPGDVLLLDRGYPAFWLFLAIVDRGADFCARLEVNKWQAAQAFVASGAADQVVSLSLCSTSQTLCRQHGFVCDTFVCRLIRVDLPNEVEVLATSLCDAGHFPTACFAHLYQQRWPVEEDYKRLKSRLQLENWSGLTPLAVRQDFYATLFTKNLAAILAHPAQQAVAHKTAARQHRYQVNMTNLISKLKDTVVLLFFRLDVRPLLHALWRQMTLTIEPVRTARSQPRKSTVRRPRFSTTYKPTR
jgi:hypothetical protein